jgi:nuclear pore complex protein Nup93
MGGLIGHLRWACTPQAASTLVDDKQIVESTDLVSLDGDVAKINRRAEEFKELHDSLQRNLHMYIPLAMDAIVGVYQKLKASSNTIDASRQMVQINFLHIPK